MYRYFRTTCIHCGKLTEHHQSYLDRVLVTTCKGCWNMNRKVVIDEKENEWLIKRMQKVG